MFNAAFNTTSSLFYYLGEYIFLGCSQRKLPLENYKLLVTEYISDPYLYFNFVSFRVSLCALKLLFKTQIIIASLV